MTTRGGLTAFARMLADSDTAPRAVQQGVTRIATDDVDRASAALPCRLLTHGARDALIDVAMSRRMLKINSSARLSTYPRAGHAPFTEDVLRSNRELAALVGGEGGPL